METTTRIGLLFGACLLAGCHFAIGERPPVDYGVFETCKSYLNGSQFNFPFGGPSIGSIAPGDIPDESKIRFGVHLSAGSVIRFSSSEFQLYSESNAVSVNEGGVISTNPGQPADESVSKSFSKNGELHNESDSARMYLIHVFSASTLPREFIVRVPDVKVWGIAFRVPDFAFKYFPDRNAIGLCN